MHFIMNLYRAVKKLSIRGMLWGLLRILLYGFVGLCLVLMLFRWLPVPTSAFMLQHNVRALFNEDLPFVRHDWVSLEEIPAAMQLAVIAAEDQRFAQHWGVDARATSAAIKAALAGRKAGGGSTITQQLAKNLFLWPERSYVRKGLEWGLAGLLETLWPKQRILEVYLNSAQFGRAEYGVAAASQHLLHKPLRKLSTQDAALLAAVLPAPARYKVAKPSRYVRKRQRWIARQMRQMGGVKYLQQLEN